MEFITALAFRRDNVFVGEHWKVDGVGRFWTSHGVVQHMPADFNIVPVHDWTIRVPEDSRVDPGKMAKVSKVFDLARSITLPLKGPGQDDLPCFLFQLW